MLITTGFLKVLTVNGVVILYTICTNNNAEAASGLETIKSREDARRIEMYIDSRMLRAGV
ncbi:MAG: hypothetical protein IPG22_03990 [Acidobacteria bacterium]|nr:hypothetical protein [Acidobacteriota bacterium]